MLVSITDNINNLKLYPTQKYLLKASEPSNVFPTIRSSPPLNVGKSIEMGGMCTPKYEISSPILYELLITT